MAGSPKLQKTHLLRCLYYLSQVVLFAWVLKCLLLMFLLSPQYIGVVIETFFFCGAQITEKWDVENNSTAAKSCFSLNPSGLICHPAAVMLKVNSRVCQYTVTSLYGMVTGGTEPTSDHTQPQRPGVKLIKKIIQIRIITTSFSRNDVHFSLDNQYNTKLTVFMGTKGTHSTFSPTPALLNL